MATKYQEQMLSLSCMRDYAEEKRTQLGREHHVNVIDLVNRLLTVEVAAKAFEAALSPDCDCEEREALRTAFTLIPSPAPKTEPVCTCMSKKQGGAHADDCALIVAANKPAGIPRVYHIAILRLLHYVAPLLPDYGDDDDDRIELRELEKAVSKETPR